MKFMYAFFFCLTITTSSVWAQDTFTIDLEITNIDNDRGTVYVALHNSEDTWLGKRFMNVMTKSNDGVATASFKEVPKGVYAIAVWHDENDNKVFDTNFLGIPKEATAASNNAVGFMSAPKWEDAKFELTNESVTMTINM